MKIHVNKNFFLRTVCFQALGSLGTEHSLSNASSHEQPQFRSASQATGGKWRQSLWQAWNTSFYKVVLKICFSQRRRERWRPGKCVLWRTWQTSPGYLPHRRWCRMTKEHRSPATLGEETGLLMFKTCFQQLSCPKGAPDSITVPAMGSGKPQTALKQTVSTRSRHSAVHRRRTHVGYFFKEQRMYCDRVCCQLTEFPVALTVPWRKRRAVKSLKRWILTSVCTSKSIPSVTVPKLPVTGCQNMSVWTSPISHFPQSVLSYHSFYSVTICLTQL